MVSPPGELPTCIIAIMQATYPPSTQSTTPTVSKTLATNREDNIIINDELANLVASTTQARVALIPRQLW